MALPTGSVRFPAARASPIVPGFDRGEFWVQDAAAALPAELLAPGLANASPICAPRPAARRPSLPLPAPRWSRSSVTRSRLARFGENLRHWRLEADLVQADAADVDAARPFDAVLLDAPCSATGTIRRHPDVPHLKRPRDVRALAETQDRLLAAPRPCCARAAG